MSSDDDDDDGDEEDEETQMQQVKLRKRGENGKNLRCKAMRSHVNQRSLAHRETCS